MVALLSRARSSTNLGFGVETLLFYTEKSALGNKMTPGHVFTGTVAYWTERRPQDRTRTCLIDNTIQMLRDFNPANMLENIRMDEQMCCRLLV